MSAPLGYLVAIRLGVEEIRFNLKHLLGLTTLAALILVLLMPFRGMLPLFYYEEFNGAKRMLESIPGLQISSSWQHKDIYLEDCGFDVSIGKSSASITFVDHQDWVGLFAEIDGIRFLSNGKPVYVTRKQLRSVGIEINGLTDVLKNLGEVQDYCSTVFSTDFGGSDEYAAYHSNFSRWITIGDPRN